MTVRNSFGILIDAKGTKKFHQAFTVRNPKPNSFEFSAHIRDIPETREWITKTDITKLNSKHYQTRLNAFYDIQNKLTAGDQSYFDKVLSFNFTVNFTNNALSFDKFDVYTSHINNQIKYTTDRASNAIKDPNHCHLADAYKLALRFIQHIKYDEFHYKNPKNYPVKSIALINMLMKEGLLKISNPTDHDVKQFNLRPNEKKPEYRKRKRHFVKTLLQKQKIDCPKALSQYFDENGNLVLRHVSDTDKRETNQLIDSLITGQEILTGEQFNGFMMEITNIAADHYFGQDYAAIRKDAFAKMLRDYNKNSNHFSRKFTMKPAYAPFKIHGDLSHYNMGYTKVTSGGRDPISAINLILMNSKAGLSKNYFNNRDVAIMTEILNTQQATKNKTMRPS